MFIRRIKIKNYRNFNEFEMEFNDGLNIIIGSNNSGKTGLMYAIKLLDSPSEINIHDFNKNNLVKFKELYINEAPTIQLEYDIQHKIIEENTEDESILKLLPFLGIGKIKESRSTGENGAQYNIYATIRATFYLDPKMLMEYKREVQEQKTYEEYFVMLSRYVDRYYLWRYTNGNTETSIDAKLAKDIFDIRFISAERTSEGVKRETRREINELITDTEKRKELDNLKTTVSEELTNILKPVIGKMADLFENENNEIGLEKGNISISSSINPEMAVESSYVTEVKDTQANYNLPLSYNGLGYNNLMNIYMLIKLSNIKKNIDFKILCLEEPEAHLHPAMQYKLFKFISNLDKQDELNQQVFVTTHSSNITAVAGLDNMFIIQYDRAVDCSDCSQQSLKKQLTGNEDETIKSDAKKYLSKFLDVTRSDMLFANNVILVEGISEKLLLPSFMDKIGVSYEDQHTSIVEIGGKHFEHFVEVFNDNPVKKKVLCITDNDFNWFADGGQLLKDYRAYEANHVKKLKEHFTFEEFCIVTQQTGGSTFEDELFLSNFDDFNIKEALFQLSMKASVKRYYLQQGFSAKKWLENQSLIDGRSKTIVEKYIKLYQSQVSKDPENELFYEKLFFSKLYLHYVKNNKGDIALSIITDEVFFAKNNITKLNVPYYIKEGLEWLNQ